MNKNMNKYDISYKIIYKYDAFVGFLKDDPIAISNVCKASPIINPPGCSWHGLAEGHRRKKTRSLGGLKQDDMIMIWWCSQWHTELEKHCRLADLLFTVLAGYGSSAWSIMIYMDIHGMYIIFLTAKWHCLKMGYCMVLPIPKGSSSASPRMLLFYGYPPSWDTPKYHMVIYGRYNIYIYTYTYTHTHWHMYMINIYINIIKPRIKSPIKALFS